MASIKIPTDRIHVAVTLDIIGTSVYPGYISHLGMLPTSAGLSYGRPVKVIEMGPPLAAGQLNEATNEPVLGNMSPHAVGWVDDMSTEERNRLQIWINDNRTRVPTQRLRAYHVSPHFFDVKDQLTGRTIYRRFSCAGFVLQCYDEAAGIKLLEWDPAYLPSIDRVFLGKIYDSVTLQLFDRQGGALGLEGEGPWKIVLCGYVLHALNRSAADIRSTPYQVKSCKEAFFP